MWPHLPSIWMRSILTDENILIYTCEPCQRCVVKQASERTNERLRKFLHKIQQKDIADFLFSAPLLWGGRWGHFCKSERILALNIHSRNGETRVCTPFSGFFFIHCRVPHIALQTKEKILKKKSDLGNGRYEHEYKQFVLKAFLVGIFHTTHNFVFIFICGTYLDTLVLT